MRRSLLILAASALVLAACGDDDAESSDAPPPTEVEHDIAPNTEGGDEQPAVVAAEFTFQPQSIEVSAGDTVVWRNEDGVGHTVTGGTPDETTGAFDEALDAGSTVEVTFDEGGEFPYFCQIHPTMTGAVVVS